MSKTVLKALIDNIHYPIPMGYVENVCIMRGLEPGDAFTAESAATDGFKGAWADCLFSLLQAVNVSEGDKSVGALTDSQRKHILTQANKLYVDIGEEPKDDPLSPKVYINC